MSSTFEPFPSPRLAAPPATDVAASHPAGDAEARMRSFKAVALPHLDDAYNLARWLTRNPQDAEDVVQEAYLRALRYFDNFRGDNPRGWILAIVRNTFYTWIRRCPPGDRAAARRVAAAAEDAAEDLAEPGDPAGETPETALARKDEATALRRLIERLPCHYREALVLREMNDCTYQQIAEITLVPIGTVMSRLSRARQLLGEAWRCHQAEEDSR